MNLSNETKQHQQAIEQDLKKLKRIFNKLVEEISKLPEIQNAITSDSKRFRFSSNKILNKKVNRLTSEFKQALEAFIKDGNAKAWLASDKKNNKLIEDIAKRVNIDIETLSKFTIVNLKALQGFQNRKVGGLNLSQRVWNITSLHRGQIEMALDLAIGEGRSAQSIARSVKSYLNEPNRLYRRVRDKHGKLKLSKPAREYNSGRGVYRSSYQNALRLARTENNMAYQQADYLKYKSLPMVVGIEVRRSNRKYDCDVCESFKGRYPADFKFINWHPNCRCHSVPILKTPAEIKADMKLLAQGKPVTKESVNRVKDINPNMRKWINDNAEKLNKSKSQPYFYRENRKFF